MAVFAEPAVLCPSSQHPSLVVPMLELRTLAVAATT
jgi:hypothetical protein